MQKYLSLAVAYFTPRQLGCAQKKVEEGDSSCFSKLNL